MDYTWMWTELSDVLLNAQVIDKVIQVIPWYGHSAGVVHGIKNGIHVKYTVFIDDDGIWDFEEID